MKRKPGDSKSAMAEGMDVLLRRFTGLDAEYDPPPAAAAPAGAGRKLDRTFTLAAQDAASSVRSFADFVCDGSSDEAEATAILDLLYNGGSGQGGMLQFSAGSFFVDDRIYGSNLQKSVTMQGTGHGTIINAAASPTFDRAGVVANIAQKARIMDMRVRVTELGQWSLAVYCAPQLRHGLVQGVAAYIDPGCEGEPSLIGAFEVDSYVTIDDCQVESGSVGTGIYAVGEFIRILNNYVRSASSGGSFNPWTGDGIYLPSGTDDSIVAGNIVKGSISKYGIHVGGDRNIVVHNNVPDGILIDSTADGTIIGGNIGPIVDNGTNTVRLPDATELTNILMLGGM